MMFHILDTELDSLGKFSNDFTICASLVNFFIGLTVTLAVSYVFSPQSLPPSAEQLSKWGIPVALLSAATFAFFSWRAFKARGSIIQKIRDETRRDDT